MANKEINKLKQLFISRLQVLSHILNVAEKHLGSLDDAVKERLAPDMHPLAVQVIFACNQPRGFSQWCQGLAVENLPAGEYSPAELKQLIAETAAMVDQIQEQDAKLDEIKRIGLGPGRYCELPGRDYVSEYLMPNFYFHITTSYAIFRHLGVPLGKADYMAFILPHVRQA
ncbi:DUF1993 domain-containing protein [Shewanella litorisediminis]|uniref:DUF1993 domain-containing protein n=1 Tax=Shewanella litorisediminis TaxID=1173586 RepID=A0ABX7G6H6_9GAMM|nr:DUF1993 domain-containing protein [Shewanella litorisediminis]MCL2916944.1 DUF1993 domain-containing protein [Shewanella litorisediminis]QRH02895.1 DUF1993 domain-containing protein [Shewanella litorisediminis]